MSTHVYLKHTKVAKPGWEHRFSKSLTSTHQYALHELVMILSVLLQQWWEAGLPND